MWWFLFRPPHQWVMVWIYPYLRIQDLLINLPSWTRLGLSRTKLNLKVNVLGNVWFIQFPSLKICRPYHLFSCLIWFLFSIFKTHHSKMWEWIGRTKIGSFHTIESWVKWHSCNKTHFARTNKLVLSNLS